MFKKQSVNFSLGLNCCKRFCCFLIVLICLRQRDLYSSDSSWAEETLYKMSLEEKIGQLFIGAAYARQEDASFEGLPPDYVEQIPHLIRTCHVGGLLFKYRWTPEQQLAVIQQYQRESSIPLLTTQDLEWGLTMRLDHALRYPKNMALGAIQDEHLLYELGQEIGRQCRIVGIQVNFAPVLDVNSQPSNPVIGERSFGAFKERVASQGCALIKGIQSQGVVACVKHFPGHGDTKQDSHCVLPLINKSLALLQEEELYPFQKAIKAGVKMVMVAHLQVPAIDCCNPTTLSKNCIQHLLKTEMGFQGLVVTDDLMMGALAQKDAPGEVALKAFLAGNDLLLSSRYLQESIAQIRNAIDQGIITESELNQKVLKILKVKEELLLPGKEMSSSDVGSLRTPAGQRLKERLYQAAITVVKDQEKLIPLKEEDAVAYLQLGSSASTRFSCLLKNKQDAFIVDSLSNEQETRDLLNLLNSYDTVTVGLFGLKSKDFETFGLSEQILLLLRELNEKKKVALVVFGTPYSLALLGFVNTIVMAYEEEPEAQEAATAVLQGHLKAMGRLPIAY